MADRGRMRCLVSSLLAALIVAGGLAALSQPLPASAAMTGCDAHPAGRVILISLTEQRLTACQDGGVSLDTPVTTGRPALPTPRGRWSILRKNSPWTMRSPWPPSSPYWYPPSRVEYAMWFRSDGYAVHDAPWRSQYGPGTQDAGTHGCVNVPRPAMDQLYAWAPVGTPVLVS
jgi:lipoprotein-anchoring transpeptidase ErfK/SrfK